MQLTDMYVFIFKTVKLILSSGLFTFHQKVVLKVLSGSSERVNVFPIFTKHEDDE